MEELIDKSSTPTPVAPQTTSLDSVTKSHTPKSVEQLREYHQAQIDTSSTPTPVAQQTTPPDSITGSHAPKSVEKLLKYHQMQIEQHNNDYATQHEFDKLSTKVDRHMSEYQIDQLQRVNDRITTHEWHKKIFTLRDAIFAFVNPPTSTKGGDKGIKPKQNQQPINNQPKPNQQPTQQMTSTGETAETKENLQQHVYTNKQYETNPTPITNQFEHLHQNNKQESADSDKNSEFVVVPLQGSVPIPEFVVEAILDHKIMQNYANEPKEEMHWLVKWKGYSALYNEWLPISHLNTHGYTCGPWEEYERQRSPLNKITNNKPQVFLLTNNDRSRGAFYISTFAKMKQLRSMMAKYTTMNELLIQSVTTKNTISTHSTTEHYKTHKLIKAAPNNKQELLKYLKKTEHADHTWASHPITYAAEIPDDGTTNSESQTNTTDTSSDSHNSDSYKPNDSDSESTDTSDKTDSTEYSSNPKGDSEPSDSQNSDDSINRKRKRKRHEIRRKNKQKDKSNTIQNKMKILNTIRQHMKLKDKYYGNTNDPLESKLYRFMLFHTEVTNVMEGVDISILFDNKLITKQEVFKMITEDMTQGYAKTMLLELQQEAKLQSNTSDNHNWEKVTTNLESYFTYIASQIFNEQEVMKMKSTIFSITKGQFSVSTLYFKIHTIYTVSKLLAPRFSCDPINEATAAEAFTKSLYYRIENVLTNKMNQENYTFTTIGILRWFRKYGELTEQRLFPTGYQNNITYKTGGSRSENPQKFITNNPMNYNRTKHDTTLTLTTTSSNPDPEGEEELKSNPKAISSQELTYMSQDTLERIRDKEHQHTNDSHQTVKPPTVTDNPLTHQPTNKDTINDANLQHQQISTNPLTIAQITHETRMSWLKDRKCINCGKPECQVKQCTKPKDTAAISKIFDELKRRRSNAVNELTEMNETLSQLSTLNSEHANQIEHKQVDLNFQ